MTNDPWPASLALFIPWFDIFTTKLTIHGPTCGVPAARITQARSEYVWLAFANMDTDNAEAEWHERVNWRDIYFNGTDAQMLGSYPTNNSISYPVGSPPPAGVLARLRKLVQQIKKSSAYTEAMGAELGILTPTAAARDPKPTKVHVEAGENSHVMIDCPLRGWDAVEIESQRGTGGWELLAVCLKRKYTDTRPPLNAGLPEVRSYRLRYRDGDQAQEVYSDVVKVTTKP